MRRSSLLLKSCYRLSKQAQPPHFAQLPGNRNNRDYNIKREGVVEKRCLYVLVPNIYNKFHITVKNLLCVSSQRITYDRYLVDDKHKIKLVESKTVSGDKTLSFRGEMTTPSVNVIKVYLR